MTSNTAAEAGLEPVQCAKTYSDETELAEIKQQALGRLIAGYQSELESGRPSPPGGWGDTLVLLLEPEVQRVARMIAWYATTSDRAEFIADSLAIVFAPRKDHPPRICMYDPKVAFVPWLSTLLTRQWIDRYRAKQRHLLLPLEEAKLGQHIPIAVSLYAERFTRHDLHRIEGWHARDRILLLSLSGLSVKMTRDPGDALRWHLWLGDYERELGRYLGRPFPPSEVDSMGSHNERKRALSPVLKIVTNTLDQYWLRNYHRLRELECIQDARVPGPE